MADYFFENQRSSSPNRSKNFDINLFFEKTANRSRSLQRERVREEVTSQSRTLINFNSQKNHFSRLSHMIKASNTTHNTPKATNANKTFETLPKVKTPTPYRLNTENSVFLKKSPFSSDSENSSRANSTLRSQIEKKLKPSTLSFIVTKDRESSFDWGSRLIPKKPLIPRSSHSRNSSIGRIEVRENSATDRVMLIPQSPLEEKPVRKNSRLTTSPKKSRSSILRKQVTEPARMSTLENDSFSKKNVRF